MKTKEKIFEYIDTFVMAILAGMSISIGCIAFLSTGNKIVGALFFTVGLFMIVNFKFNLFTGKVCYSLDNKPEYLLKLIVIWIGNFCGAGAMGLLASITRLSSLQEACKAICEVKLNDTIGSVIILAVFCNIMIYLAVEGYARFETPIAKMVALFFGVSIFVLCGFEHCVANMFYFTFGGAWTAKTILYIFLMTLGNAIGGLLIPFVFKMKEIIATKKAEK